MKLNATKTNGKTDNMHLSDNPENIDANPAPRGHDGVKTIALPLFVFILVCIIIAILKVRYGRRRKIGSAAHERKKILIPCENPINIRFKSLIGRGSFGVVWKATLDDATVAVKMCSAEKQERWEKEREILANEAEHPNVIKMIDSEVRRIKEDIALLIILEFIDGGNLRTYLTENTFNIDRALSLLKSLVDGLAFLHSPNCPFGVKKKGIVHRDMKSANVLISSSKGCVIADFGLALSYNFRDKISLHDAKAKVGTSRYMAPEKLSGFISRNNLWRSLCSMDVYATAIVAYEIMKRYHFQFDNNEQGSYTPGEFSLPFLDMVGTHPTNDEMRRLVVDDDVRPSIPDEWKKCKVMDQVSNLLVQSWNRNPNKRLSAANLLEIIKEIYLHHELRTDVTLCAEYTSDEEGLLLEDPRIELNSNISYVQINTPSTTRSSYL